MVAGLFDHFGQPPEQGTPSAAPPTVDVDALSPARSSYFDGDKFYGGFGQTTVFTADYWTLRARSAQLFTENLYARGLIRRLVTNEINTGLNLEAEPEEAILGYKPDALNEWSENVECRFTLWGNNPQLCDYRGRATWGELQRLARLEALVEGDVLVVCRINKRTGLPAVQLFRGGVVNTPANAPRDVDIRHGVQFDKDERQVGYWVTQKDGSSKYLPAYGPRSGRRMAWLVYGTDRRLDDVRGQPLLSLVLQSLKELDRYRDSAQRKAVINSILAMFIQKESDQPGTLPITGGAVRRENVQPVEADGKPRGFSIAKQIPGLVIEELNKGEKPVGFQGATDVQLGVFEEAIIQAIAWANEVPPEILRLAFSNNYSASQAAINEFKIYLNLVRTRFGAEFCQPVYQEWLISETLAGKIQAPGLLEAWRNPLQYDRLGAWLASDWSGAIKPSTDIKKQAEGYKSLNAEGWITNDRAARELTGTKFTKNVKRIKRENQLKADAARPLLDLQKEYGQQLGVESGGSPAETAAAVAAALEDYFGN